MFSKSVFIIFLLSLALFTRFYGLNWGSPYFFHPDENNMASALSQLSLNNLNPHFFAYGQFPLYLGFFTLKLFGITNTFAASVYILRFYSALFSLLSLYFFYKIYPQTLFILLLIFTPGLIQLAHFGTTESLLIFLFSLNLYLAKLILKKATFKLFVFSSLVTGIALATKISGLFVLLPVFLASVFNRSFRFFLLSSPLTLFFAFIFSPYNLLAFTPFLSALRYETAVASGSLPVFYTRQFVSSLPYIFQFQRIFPYVVGLPIFIFAFLSLPFLNFQKLKKSPYFWVISLPLLIYFLYFGALFVKWTRFMSPLFFVFPLLATPFLNRFRFLIPLALLPGLFFFANYFLPDTRREASSYLLSQLPSQSFILSESGNVVDLPLAPHSFNFVNYDFYQYHPQSLSPLLARSDYLLVPSRRVFKNYPWPYYDHLFDGSLGFSLQKTFTPIPDFLLNAEAAEETWTVFDRPTLRLYQKSLPLSPHLYETLL